jgi:hypothetical protein
LPSLPVPGVPVVGASTTGHHIDALTVPASAFNVVDQVLPVTDPFNAPIKGIELNLHNAAGQFSGAILHGAMPLNGTAKVCLFKLCSNARANVSVPISVVGAGGAATGSGTVSFTVRGAPWTAGVAAVGTITRRGFAHGPASGTSSTAQHSGVARLVTPIFISTNLPPLAVIPAFVFLDLHFAPEPSTLLLLAGGIAGLVMLGRARRG